MIHSPYLLISDPHYHDWSAFSTDEGALNSRLKGLIRETVNAARELRIIGGNAIIFPGDVFHVRGKIAPSVLNPVTDMFRGLVKAGFDVHVLPGNHDLEKNSSERVGNAVTALESVGVKVYHQPRLVDEKFLFVPWYPTVDDLLEVLRDYAGTYDASEITAFIHAPVDGVLPHIPHSNLTPKVLGDLGFNRVFAGHYHNHVDFGNRVYSVGALTHQTWSDVNSKAGFVIVDETGPQDIIHRETKAPKFIELSGEESIADLKEIVPGNYIRLTLAFEDMDEIETFRPSFESEFKPAGLVINPVKKATGRAPTSGPPVSMTLEQSLADYIKLKGYSEQAAKKAIDLVRGLTK